MIFMLAYSNYAYFDSKIKIKNNAIIRIQAYIILKFKANLIYCCFIIFKNERFNH